MGAMNRRQFVKIGAVAGLSVFALGALPGCGQKEVVGTDSGEKQAAKTMRTVTRRPAWVTRCGSSTSSRTWARP